MSASSPATANTSMPKSRTREAAVSSWVDSGLEAHSVTFAPEAESARMRFAVSVVTCMQAPMRTPSKGFSRSKRSRMDASTGMSRSAHRMRARPSSARAMSLISWFKGMPPLTYKGTCDSRSLRLS